MSLWAGIKYALNSTLGTNDFEPLDKMILGQKQLLASDNVYQIVKSNAGSVTNPATLNIDLFKLKINGSFKIRAYGSASYNPGTIRILKNGVDITSISVEVQTEDRNYDSSVINAERNDTISVILSAGTNGRLYVYTISILADIIDGSAIELL